jgi:hypothetical protein
MPALDGLLRFVITEGARLISRTVRIAVWSSVTRETRLSRTPTGQSNICCLRPHCARLDEQNRIVQLSGMDQMFAMP